MQQNQGQALPYFSYEQKPMYPPQYQMGPPQMDPPVGYATYHPQGQPITNYPQPGYGAPPPAYDNGNLPPAVVYQPVIDYQQTEVLVVTTQKYQQISQLPKFANGLDHPARIHCSTCNRDVTTVLKHQVGTGTWICCIICFFFVASCYVPFIEPKLQDKIHICPSCKNKVGYYEYKICSS